MKVQTSQLLGIGAFMIGRVLAQEEASTCPAGYSPVVSYITVTASALPAVTATNGVCPSGYSPVVSYITVTTSVSAAEATSTSVATTTTPVSITPVSTTPVSTTAVPTSSEEPTTTIYTSLTSTSTVTVGKASTSSYSAVNAVEASTKKTGASTAASSTSSAASTSSTSASTVLGSELSGQATYYGGNVAGGACSFSTYTLPSGIYGTALSDSNWDNSGECGACVSVSYGGKSITAMIVDECPGCGTNHLDLFPTAFSALADSSLGIIDVTWEYVSCPITSAIQLHNKDGVSAYWFSMQVVNANAPVSSLEVSTDGGSTWISTTRQTYNFFEISAGTGTTTVDVKVTSTTGMTITVNNVAISSGASTTASSNF